MMVTEWTLLTERLPDPEEHSRVLIYTADHDFDGEQYFDVEAESLNALYFENPEDMPETAAYATHWAPRPFG